MNAWCGPQRGLLWLIIRIRLRNLLRHAGPAWLSPVDFPRPNKQAKAFTLPSDNCVGLDNHQHRFPVAGLGISTRRTGFGS